MKRLIYIILILCGAMSCSSNAEYKYKIVGKVMTKADTLHDAVAYTDTIHGYNEDSIWYYNSNGSKLTILSPYKVYNINH